MTTAPDTAQEQFLYGPNGQRLTGAPTSARAIVRPTGSGDWHAVTTQGSATVWEKPRTEPTPAPAPAAPADDRRTRRMRAGRAEQRTDREHALTLEAQRRDIKRTDQAARREQQRADQAAARADRQARRAERRAANADRDARIKQHLLAVGRRVMVIGPITAPMAVAWSSQTSYAMDAFGWWMIAALGFAAAWELSTTFTGWMYHQARKDGDRGTEYRILTWIFAMGAAAMNYAHHCGPKFAPTQSAVAFSAMSVTGMVLWEAYARLVHRQHLRAEGLVPKARPRLGLVRWVRYPVHSWTAWSLAILDPDLDTAVKSWTAAADRLAVVRADRTRRTNRWSIRRTAAVDHTRSTDRADHRTGPDRTVDHAAPKQSRTTVQTDRTSVDHADQTVRTVVPASTGPAVDHLNRTAQVADRVDHSDGPQAASGPDQTPGPLVLTDQEQRAVQTLRSKDQPINRRSIADTIRSEGGSIGTGRATEIARHFRALRTAA